MKILTLNAGSNSLKFEIVEAVGRDAEFGRSLVSGSYDNIGKDNGEFSLFDGKRPKYSEKREVRDHGHATELLFGWIESGQAREQGIGRVADIDRIGHRVVHGADRFTGPVRISDAVVKQIEDLADLAPLHNESALKVIAAARSRVGDRVPMVAVFDTVFHQTIPEYAALYPLPLELAKEHKIRRYGFHGISHRYMMLRYAEITGRPLAESKLITMHLEGGSSLCAIENGRSVDTSMGFTPLEGLMMGTRCGDIDPAIVTYLMRKLAMDASEVETFLNKNCGLLGVSGISADTRDLLRSLEKEPAEFAIEMFAYRVRKYLGAYLAALGGADAIVFGGGIGENTPMVREKITDAFAWCGMPLDAERNRAIVDREGLISGGEAAIEMWVIPTQEGLMMAREVATVPEREG